MEKEEHQERVGEKHITPDSYGQLVLSRFLLVASLLHVKPAPISALPEPQNAAQNNGIWIPPGTEELFFTSYKLSFII